MNKKLLQIGIIIILVIVAITIISFIFLDEKDKFIGTWKDTKYGDHIIFYPDGTYFSEESQLEENIEGTWEIKDGELRVNAMGLLLIFDYSFSNNDNTLTLESKISDQILVLKRQ